MQANGPTPVSRWSGFAFESTGAFREESSGLQTRRGLLLRALPAEPGGTLGQPFGVLSSPHAIFAFGAKTPHTLASGGVAEGIPHICKGLRHPFASIGGTGPNQKVKVRTSLSVFDPEWR
jgi:hypothetical protein